MRYYKIIITDTKSGQVFMPPGFSGLLGGASYTSFVNGQTLPAAWDIELDLPVIGQATPQGQGILRIWGISLQEIAQASNLNGKNIQVFGGMQAGLPLAKPQQSGLLVQGTIFQAFGNWIETDQTLDIVIMPGISNGSTPGGIGTLAAPKNIVLNWPAGQTLGVALQNALQVAFPGVTVNVSTSSNLVRANAELGFFPTLEQLAQFARMTSFDIIKTTGYAGVSIVFGPDNSISVTDASQSPSSGSSPKQIAFEDLIGQPTWIEAPTMQFKTVMRADLKVWDEIMMPPAITTNTASALSSLLNQQASFQGSFQITNERHVGRFRQPTADSWVTVFEAVPLTGLGTSS